MNWEVIGATGEWAGAIAVVATLFYLSRQIKIASNQIERQIDIDLRNRMYSAYDPIYQGDNADIFYRGLFKIGELTESENFTFDLLMGRQASSMANIAEDVFLGRITSERARARAEFYKDQLIDTPGGIEWFYRRRENLKFVLSTLGLRDQIVSYEPGKFQPSGKTWAGPRQQDGDTQPTSPDPKTASTR